MNKAQENFKILKSVPQGYLYNKLMDLICNFESKNSYVNKEDTKIYIPYFVLYLLKFDLASSNIRFESLKNFCGYEVLQGYEPNKIIIAHKDHALYENENLIQSIDLKIETEQGKIEK